eukprot:m.242027 g.242027  ORF g.242027 m.242027 type:complete len:442 (-) comp17451_c1_seq3:2843-4168(-)
MTMMVNLSVAVVVIAIRLALSHALSTPHRYCLAQCAANDCCHDQLYSGENFSTWTYVVQDTRQPAQDDDITLVTFGTLNRLATFERTRQRWDGPIVYVIPIYVHTAELKEAAATTILSLKDKVYPKTLVIVIYISHVDDFYSTRFRREKQDPTANALLPLNTLRNIALDLADTLYVFPLDLDFVPSGEVYAALQGLLPTIHRIPRAAIVLPNFESLDCDNPDVPATFGELHRSLMAGRVRPFFAEAQELIPNAPPAIQLGSTLCFEEHPDFARGVNLTNYGRWLNESSQGLQGFFKIHTELKASIPSLKTDTAWESFAVLRKEDIDGYQLPRYREGFVGRYFDKISFLVDLRAQAYNFYTLRQHLVTHVPHRRTQSGTVPHYEFLNKAMKKLFDNEKRELQATVRRTRKEIVANWKGMDLEARRLVESGTVLGSTEGGTAH